MSNIRNGEMELAGLFNDTILVVPPFQRAFAWGNDQLRDFIGDLQAHPAVTDEDSSQNYFLGSILLTRSTGSGDYQFERYAVVDGQQRITTSCIFVAAALPLLDTDPAYEQRARRYRQRFMEDDGVRKFHTIGDDDAFFDRYIIGTNVASSINCVTPSQKRLLAAKNYFSHALGKLPLDQIDCLIRVLWKSKILVYSVNTDVEATQIFEFQNDRGKRLTDLEALKSYLMHGLYLYAGAGVSSDLKIVQSDFSELYRAMEKVEARIAAPGEDQILSYHCLAFEKAVQLEGGVEGWRRPKQLVRHILGKIATGKAQWIKDFSNRLMESYRAVDQILDARDNNFCDPMGDLTVIRRLAPFWPLLIKCWKFDNTPDKKDFSAATLAMERFSFRAIIAGKRSDTGEAHLRWLASKFSGNFKQLIADLTVMQTKWDIERYFRYGLDSEMFYEFGSIVTYLLWRYENYLRSQRGQQTPRLDWKTVVAPANNAVRYEKDHIEPKDPNNTNLKLLVKWDPSNPTEKPREFSEVFLHRLGNLVLDTFSTGSAKGNSDFAKRVSHYTANSALLSQGEIVSRFASKDPNGNPIWDEDAIRRRHSALVDFALTKM